MPSSYPTKPGSLGCALPVLSEEGLAPEGPGNPGAHCGLRSPAAFGAHYQQCPEACTLQLSVGVGELEN
jgi:hypothetical protein